MQCDVCHSSNVVLSRRENAGWPLIWLCLQCYSSVGCHVDTEIPMGPLAPGKVRMLRRLAHISFDQIWLVGIMSRERAKRWMGDLLGLEQEFHISHLPISKLKLCIKYSEDYLKSKAGHKLVVMKERRNERIAKPLRKAAKLNAVYAERRKNKRGRKHSK